MSIQRLNQELIDLLGTSFVLNNYASTAVGNITSILSAIPGVRGAWIASSFDENGDMFDLSEQGRDLTYNGTPEYDYSGLIPYVTFDGTNDYFERLDEAGLDITGLETYVASAKRGLSIGGWFYVDSVLGTHYLMSKYRSANDISYELLTNGTNAVFQISSTGAVGGVVSVTSSVTLAINTWYFIVGTYDPSTQLAVWVNKVEDTNAVGIPASIFSGAADFQIGGRDNVATGRFDGNFSFGFLSTMFLSDTIIKNLYHQSRSLFGG